MPFAGAWEPAPPTRFPTKIERGPSVVHTAAGSLGRRHTGVPSIWCCQMDEWQKNPGSVFGEGRGRGCTGSLSVRSDIRDPDYSSFKHKISRGSRHVVLNQRVTGHQQKKSGSCGPGGGPGAGVPADRADRGGCGENRGGNASGVGKRRCSWTWASFSRSSSSCRIAVTLPLRPPY